MSRSIHAKKEVIREKAEELFSANGYQNTTISDIAKAANISEATIYEHFRNKEDLLFYIPEKSFLELMKSLEEHLLGIKGPENQLRKFIWHYLSFMEDRRDFARLFILGLWSNRRFYESEKSTPLKDYGKVLKNILRDGVEEGIFRSGFDLDICQAMILGTMNHIILSLLMLEKPLYLVSKGEALEQLFFSAIKKRSEKKHSIWGPMGKREKILEAALEEFSRKGYEQTTVSQIAARAGITDPTVYEYFKSKEDILMGIPERAVEKFLGDLKSKMANMHSPENIFRLFLWNQVRSYDNYPDYYKVLLGEIRCNPRFYKSKAYEVIRQYSRELMNILRSGVEAGVFRGDLDLGLVRDMYFGTLDQLLLNRFGEEKEQGLSGKIDAIYDLFIHALEARAGNADN
ncbi:MAG: TetR/AcrR family transcriptional regulator [Desulfotomaculales bacterium]